MASRIVNAAARGGNFAGRSLSNYPMQYSPRRLTLLGIGMGVFMSTLDSSIVNIALPTLAAQFQTGFATVQWVVLSYLLVIAGFMLTAARLGDLVGKKRLYLMGLAGFTVSSLLCGLSPNIWTLIAFRALQGLGAVWMVALGVAIVSEVYPREERGRAIGLIGGVVSLGIAFGPTIGGLLIGTLGWRAIFLVNVPVGIATLFVVARHLPAIAPAARRQRFDIAGAALLFLSLTAYALGMTLGQPLGFKNGVVLFLLGASIAGTACFLLLERRIADPMIDPGMFRNARFSTNLILGCSTFIVMAGYALLLPFYLEHVKGFSTEQTGLMIAVVPAMMGLVAPMSGSLSDRVGPHGIVVVGLLLLAAGYALASTLGTDTSVAGYVLRVAPIGIALGIFQSPNNTAIMQSAPRERLGVASGLLSLSRVLGQSTGIPLIGALFTTLSGAGGDIAHAAPEALVRGLHGTFLFAAAVILLVTPLAVLSWHREREPNQ